MERLKDAKEVTVSADIIVTARTDTSKNRTMNKQLRVRSKLLRRMIRRKCHVQLGHDELIFYVVFLLWLILRSSIVFSSGRVFFMVVTKLFVIIAITFAFFRILENILTAKRLAYKQKNLARRIASLVFAVSLYFFACLIGS